nr:hypothetical protein [Tanacetum cinerariifolium]
MKVSKRWLKDTFEAVPKDISEDAIAPYDLSPLKLNDVAWGAAALAMLHTSLGSDGKKNVNGPIWIVEFFFWKKFLILPILLWGLVHLKRKQSLFFVTGPHACFDQIIYHEPEKGFPQLDIINLQPVGKLDVLFSKSSRGCQKRKLKDPYLPYIEVWKNRHLEMNCIKDDRPCFLLPSMPAENDSDGPQSNQQNDLDGCRYFAFMIADISNNDQIGSINDASLNSEIMDEDQETSPFCNDDQIDSINDASLNPKIRDDVGSSMSPKLKKRVIKVRPDLNVNIARGRDQKTPKSIFSPSGKKRKPHVRGIKKKGTQCNFGKALSIALRRGTSICVDPYCMFVA